MRERVHHPAGIRELLQLLKVPREERATFKRQINALVASGELIQLRGHRVGLPEKMDLHVGRLQTHAGGYGFVIPERPLESGGDIYISGPLLNDAMNAKAPGGKLRLRITRGERTLDVDAEVARNVKKTYRLSEVPEATAAQRTIFNHWLRLSM